ncbi:hypothetical protein [Ulvibacterium sp.]|uniref:hypothetical protein n=1 Tax=Ulvibacterium sp. TaxID=2665914 RepID=UPI002610603E|nr:hypothetical protein [Ulvibacterium sp.]
MGTSARRFCLEPFILKRALETQKPKLIVIDISSTTITKPDSDKSWYFNNKALSNYNLSMDKLVLLNDIIPSNRYELWLQGLSSTTRNLYNLTVEQKLQYYEQKKSVISGRVLGFEPKRQQNEKSLEKYKEMFETFYKTLPSIRRTKYNRIDEVTLEKLEELLTLAEKKPKIEFLLVNNVKIDASSENILTIESIKKLIRNYKNVSILELNTIEAKTDLDLRFEDFYDPVHVTQSGAAKITSYFSRFLERNYNFVGSNIEQEPFHVFKIGNTRKTVTVRDVRLLVGDDYKTDIRIIMDSIPVGYDEVSTVISIFPKKGFEHLLEEKSKKHKWKSDNAYRKLKNYIKISEGYVGKLNSWSKLKPSNIDRIEIRFIEKSFSSQKFILPMNEVNILN